MKSLTRDLTAIKRGYTMSSSLTSGKSSGRRRSDPGASHLGHRFTHSASRLSNSNNIGRSRRISSSESRKIVSKMRTPSPSGGRFDPTAYVKQKKRQREAQLG